MKAARKALGEVSKSTEVTTEPQKHPERPSGRRVGSHSLRHGSTLLRHWPARVLAVTAVPAFLLLAGCGGSASGSSNNGVAVSPGTATIDTNCTGCNAASNSGAYEQFTATLNSGGTASVAWSVSGGDSTAGAGTITASGQYTPPPYLTADSVHVTVTATPTNGSGASSATVTVTPGFLEPLSPENISLGSGGTAAITGYIAEAGGSTSINFAVASSTTGSSGGQGSVGSPSCVRSSSEFT